MPAICAGKCTSTARLDGKTVVITGCNTGIGKFCVADFYKRGARVIMACRSTEKAEAAKKEVMDDVTEEDVVGAILVKKLDLTSLESVRKCAKDILDSEERVDILLNNAGVMMTPNLQTEDGFEMQFGTNHLGHFLLTTLLLPRILRSTPARIVNVSSMAHQWSNGLNFDDLNFKETPYNSKTAYGHSKLANILFTKELATRLEGRNVNAYSLHPGIIATDLFRNMDETYFKGAEFMFNLATGWLQKTPLQGAQTNIYCCVDEKCAAETGLYYKDCKTATPSRAARDEVAARRLWDESVNFVNLDFDPFTVEDEGPTS